MKLFYGILIVDLRAFKQFISHLPAATGRAMRR